MKEIKNLQTQERQRYVPASVKVIEVAAQRTILAGSIPNDPGEYGGNTPWTPSH